MSYNLFIVESPAKCDKIEKYLGPGNKCIASYGHFRELNGLQSINIHKNFEPSFIISENKQSQVNKIRKCIKDAKEVYLASDDDREGEAIAWHICDYFNLPIGKTKRIVFHEVTESALLKAVKEYRYLNMKTVNAQLARQVLDILVGYKLSPILWKNVKDKTSAGRCQTPALRLIYDNYKEIKASPGTKEYNTIGYFTSKNIPFELNHNFADALAKPDALALANITAFLKESINFDHMFSFGELRDSTKQPPAPFTTSKLQQDASSNLHCSPKETMSICQKLYEEGLITYMRTDSSTYSKEFVDKTITYINNVHGDEYVRKDIACLHEGTNTEAHEAIRPTNINFKELDKTAFSSKECKMYQLIWSNSLESCMSPALYKGLTAKVTAPQNHTYKFITEQVIFPGWKVVNGYEEISKEFTYLQSIKKDSVVKCKKITAKMCMRDLKSHYTEAKLVQLLEQKGIGRPSTFSSLIEKIQERGYVKKENVKGASVKCIDYELTDGNINTVIGEREFGNEKNKLVIKPLGIMVLEYLLTNFNDVFEYNYTKKMEEHLDDICNGDKVWHELCRECLNDLDAFINLIGDEKKGKQNIRIDNENVFMIGKYGPVIKCQSNEEEKGKVTTTTTFKAVNPDIDIDKLKNGEYTLEDVVAEEASPGRSLGMYKTKEVVLRSGKFGWYIEWGTEKKSLKIKLEQAAELTLDDISDTLYDMENGDSAIIRHINKETSIRKGKYGDYIFHKNSKMKKPKFLKIEGLSSAEGVKGDYKNCDIEFIHSWLSKTYDIKNK